MMRHFFTFSKIWSFCWLGLPGSLGGKTNRVQETTRFHPVFNGVRLRMRRDRAVSVTVSVTVSVSEALGEKEAFKMLRARRST
jgi:hypothetical protein